MKIEKYKIQSWNTDAIVEAENIIIAIGKFYEKHGHCKIITIRALS